MTNKLCFRSSRWVKNMDKRKRKKLIILSAIILIIAVAVGASAIYLGDYYRTDYDSVQAFSDMDKTAVRVLDDGTIIFEPDAPTKALIFYPGGKVEYTAYQPLMAACAKQGILCILVKMPFNLAVFDVNAADGVQEMYPEIDSWYIGGHSLGGAMAASYVGNHKDEYDGLILLGAYSTEDLSDSGLDVLSVYGSADKVLNIKKYEKYKSNLPEKLLEIVIEGGCHSYFGMYGMQDGDGTPEITNEEQIYITAELICEMMGQ